MHAQRAQSLITVMSGGFFLSGELFSSYQTDLQALWLYPLTIVRVVEHVIVARHFGRLHPPPPCAELFYSLIRLAAP
jgi:hypothetical protein